MPKLKVMIAASEAVPFIKTGGLADVSGSLPIYLKKFGVEAFVVIPKYRDIDFKDCYLENVLPTMCVRMGNGEEWCSVFKTVYNEVDFYFIEHHNFFSREGLYHDNVFNDYQDNAWRFGFFSMAALQLCRDLKLYRYRSCKRLADGGYSRLYKNLALEQRAWTRCKFAYNS